MNEEPAETSHGEETMSAADLAAIRDIVLRAHPETVPELITGGTVAEMLGSVEAAAAAYQRIAEDVAARAPATAPAAPVVPAGSSPPVAVDPERLPPVEKIHRGLQSRR